MNLLGWPRRRGVRGMEFRPFAQDLKERGARGADSSSLGTIRICARIQRELERIEQFMQTDIDAIIDNFELLDDWEDRYRYLIELGRTLEPLSKEAYSEANKVRGCASQVWLDTKITHGEAGQKVLIFHGDSDAHIVRGLVALVLALYSGRGRPRFSNRRRASVRAARSRSTLNSPTRERPARHGRTHQERGARRRLRLFARDRARIRRRTSRAANSFHETLSTRARFA